MEGGESEKEISKKKGIEVANPQINLITATTDDNLKDIFLNIRASKSPTVINYGASWCHLVKSKRKDSRKSSHVRCRVCSQILPIFCQLSNKYPKLSFVYADIDECPETTQHIRYTPTFHFYRDGERVDEMFGAGEERLQDRLWLHS